MHASLGKYTSDVFKTLSVIGAYENVGGGQKFCSEHFVRPKVGLDLSVIYYRLSFLPGDGGNS
jgi:hypothetical protein